MVVCQAASDELNFYLRWETGQHCIHDEKDFQKSKTKWILITKPFDDS